MIIYKKRPKEKKEKHPSKGWKKRFGYWFAWYPVLTGRYNTKERDWVWLETVHRIPGGLEGFVYTRANQKELKQLKAILNVPVKDWPRVSSLSTRYRSSSRVE
jgi:hypothetical protein